MGFLPFSICSIYTILVILAKGTSSVLSDDKTILINRRQQQKKTEEDDSAFAAETAEEEAFALPFKPITVPIDESSSGDFFGQIVGGTAVGQNDFPYFVQLYDGGGCGGTLVASNIVLTAAHCPEPDDVWVKGTGSGSMLLNGGIQRSVELSIVHPDYDDGNPNSSGFLSRPLDYDFRLLCLDSDVTGIDPVSLSSSTTTPSSVTVIGYGRTCNSCGLSPTLQRVTVDGISFADCEEYYDSFNFGPIINDIHLCYGNVPGQGACRGDSGGPVFDASTLDQHGIVSFGGDCEDGSDSVAARVGGDINWIINETDRLANEEHPCFSSHTTVTVQGKGEGVPMKDIEVGDKVLTASGQYETVYAISHLDRSKLSYFLQIHTTPIMKEEDDEEEGENCSNYINDHHHDHHEHPLEMTARHMLFVEGKSLPVPAGSIRVGDLIQTHHERPCMLQVTKISTINREGFFNPLTRSGTIVVNHGIVASTYSAFLMDSLKPKEYLEIAGFNVMSYQTFSHMAFAPIRTICLGVSLELCNLNNKDKHTNPSPSDGGGSSDDINLIRWYRQLGQSLVNFWKIQNAFVQWIILLSLVTSLGSINLIGNCFIDSTDTTAIVTTVILVVLCLSFQVFVYRTTTAWKKGSNKQKTTATKKLL